MARDMRASACDRVAVVVIVFPFFGLRGPTRPSALMEVMGDGVLMSKKRSAKVQQECHGVQC
jgi:hypothetical protein